MLPQFGYALVEEELSKRELDDDILSKENEILQHRQIEDNAFFADGSKNIDYANNNSKNVMRDLNSNQIDDNNNNSSSHTLKKRNKSALNVSTDDLSCPGLATAAVTYKLD